MKTVPWSDLGNVWGEQMLRDFEQGYERYKLMADENNVSGMTFSEALEKVKRGEGVARRSWAKESYIFRKQDEDGNPYFFYSCVGGSGRGWSARAPDIFADDWETRMTFRHLYHESRELIRKNEDGLFLIVDENPVNLDSLIKTLEEIKCHLTELL